ncbi:unnamed protein product [Adineta ricciae]|uniref:Cell division cycle protein 123 homolog n=1 Tax=Adineta ricciae TaxID=249248 RepID=A0A814CPS6_ADIRI|nr:unnamed protein product [Adineta ricciae]CAF1117080.1 unnamed protein product [Adineta ricciae]
MMDETQFERYYEAIKQWTFPSVILPANENQIVALRNGHELFKSLSSTDDDEKTEECFRKYPDLAELAARIDSCSIKRPVFVRLSTRSPKDAVLLLNKDKFKQIFQQIFNELKSDETSKHNQQMIALDEASIRILAVYDGFHAVQLLLASERIQDDLKSSLSLNLIVREFLMDRQSLKSEFRAFIYKRKLTALTQYNEYIVDRVLIEQKRIVLESVENFFKTENLLEQIPYDNCVLDLILIENSPGNYRVYICEVNPLAEFAGTGLFSWLNDRAILLGDAPFEFRIRESETKESNQADKQWLSLINHL